EIQAGYPAPLFAPNQKLRSRNVNIDPGAYASSCGQYSHPRNPYSHPRNVYSHPRNLYSLPAGISIHIVPESLFTSTGIRKLCSHIADNLVSGPVRLTIHSQHTNISLDNIDFASRVFAPLLHCSTRPMRSLCELALLPQSASPSLRCR